MGTKVTSKQNLSKLETVFFIKCQGAEKKLKLGALEFNHVMSPCEKYLYVQLCNSKTEDAGKFIKIDVTTGERGYSVNPEWGWARDYMFSNGGDIIAETDRYGSWQVDANGSIIDRAGYYMCRVTAADYGAMSALPEYFDLHGKTPETCAMAMKSLEKFLMTCPTMFHGLSYGALALKSRAEIQMFLGDNVAALQSCVDALCLDPKVTVKRMLNSISKKLKLDKNALKPSDWVESLRVAVENNRNIELKKMEENSSKIKDRNAIVIGDINAGSKILDTKNSLFKYFVLIILLVIITVCFFK